MTWTQPICERCWFEQHGEWEENEEPVATGTEAPARLLSYREPVRVKDAELEQCAFCGGPTIFGAFVRADPALVPYPRTEREPA